MLFVGGSRAHHYQELFKEIGMTTMSAGYEFGHRDDYEGRKVIPSITVDADTRNIEELTVEADPARYRPRKDEAAVAGLQDKDLRLGDYEGMMAEMKDNALIIDDLNHHEAEILLERYKPDVFCAGIKEKYVIQKSGVPLKQLHSYDYSGPYAGFRGAINFYREIDRLVNSRIFSYIKAPWDKNPELAGSYVWNKGKEPKRLRRRAMLLRHTPEQIADRQALTINPAKTCQPVGAMYAALGIHNCLPHSHGSQGCCAYHRSALTSHYKDPIMATTSSFTEGASVFGGQANLVEAINNIFTIYGPEVIAVHTTCLSEVIGDDLAQIINKAQAEGRYPKARASSMPTRQVSRART